jgi:hypothetical protein
MTQTNETQAMKMNAQLGAPAEGDKPLHLEGGRENMNIKEMLEDKLEKAQSIISEKEHAFKVALDQLSRVVGDLSYDKLEMLKELKQKNMRSLTHRYFACQGLISNLNKTFGKQGDEISDADNRINCLNESLRKLGQYVESGGGYWHRKGFYEINGAKGIKYRYPNINENNVPQHVWFSEIEGVYDSLAYPCLYNQPLSFLLEGMDVKEKEALFRRKMDKISFENLVCRIIEGAKINNGAEQAIKKLEEARRELAITPYGIMQTDNSPKYKARDLTQSEWEAYKEKHLNPEAK